MPGFPVLHYFLGFAQIQVHWVYDAIQPSPLLSPSPPSLNLSHHHCLFQWMGSLHQVAQLLQHQLQHQSFHWILRVDFLSDWLVWSPCSPRDSTQPWVNDAAAAKLLQSCLTLCDPIDSSPPGSSVPGILQTRILECVAISFSNAWKWKVKVKLLSCIWLFATTWTIAYQAPPSMGFSRQEY